MSPIVRSNVYGAWDGAGRVCKENYQAASLLLTPSIISEESATGKCSSIFSLTVP